MFVFFSLISFHLGITRTIKLNALVFHDIRTVAQAHPYLVPPLTKPPLHVYPKSAPLDFSSPFTCTSGNPLRTRNLIVTQK